MFNIWAFEKKNTLHSSIELEKQKYLKRENLRKMNQGKFIVSYKKRIEDFMLKMNEKPVHIKDKTNIVVKIRDEEPKKFLGAPSFRYATNASPTRALARESIDNFKPEADEPYKTPKVEWRIRDQSKEIQPEMRFASDSAERIARSLENMLKNSDHLSTDRQPEKLSDNFLRELSKNPGALKKYIATTIMPELHQKTHFRAATSFFLRLPDILKEDSDQMKENKKSKEESSIQNEVSTEISPNTQSVRVRFKGTKNDTENDQKDPSKEREGSLPPIKLRHAETLDLNERDGIKDWSQRRSRSNLHPRVSQNPSDLSKSILLKCGVINKRNENIPVLKKGEGHLISIPDRSLKQIYHDLYPSTIDYTQRNSDRK